MLGTSELLSAFDVDAIATEALLFQTGYLTVRDERRLGGNALYRLGYPNREVRQSLNRSLLRYLVRDVSGEEERYIVCTGSIQFPRNDEYLRLGSRQEREAVGRAGTQL